MLLFDDASYVYEVFCTKLKFNLETQKWIIFVTCEMRSPTVTANWLTVPSPPRKVRGEISEMYIGTRDVFKPEIKQQHLKRQQQQQK
jgi:hypothetical protein